MEIDATPVPPPQDYSDKPLSNSATLKTSQQQPLQKKQQKRKQQQNSIEPSMNFDYLHSLHDNRGNRTQQQEPQPQQQRRQQDIPMESARYFNSADNAQQATGSSSNNQRNYHHQQQQHQHRNTMAPGTGTAGETPSYGHVDDRVVDRIFNTNERFVTVLDQLDARVEKFRKDALGLQERKDFLLMSIDLIKSHDMLPNMMDCERDEIGCYIQRVNSRLSTVELNVRTVRDQSQEDSLSQINALIDAMITMGDPVMSRQRCQQYLNSCSSNTIETTTAGADAGANYIDPSGISDFYSTHSYQYDRNEQLDVGPVDKKFESALLGCTLDDQKKIKKRLHALMHYLNKQIIRLN